MVKFPPGSIVYFPDQTDLVGTPFDDPHLSTLARRLLGLQAIVTEVDTSTTPPTYTVTFSFKFRENELQSGQEHAIHHYVAQGIRTALTETRRPLTRKRALKLI